MTDPPRIRTANTRARKQRGLLAIRVEIHAHERAKLVQQGLLRPEAVNDKQACREALHALLGRIFPPP